MDVALPIRNFCSIDGHIAKDKRIPTGKVDRVIAFGVLTFGNSLYFKFITRLENLFVQCLSYEQLVEHIKNAYLNVEIFYQNFHCSFLKMLVTFSR